MTNSEKPIKKKQGIVRRMMFGSDNKPDLTPEKMQVSKWTKFKQLFFGRFGTMVMLNILSLLFAIPAVLVILLFYGNSTIAASFIPYSSNIGIGYPVVVDAIKQGVAVRFSYTLMEFVWLVPCVALFALGISGNLYVMRKLIWDEPTRTVKDFFRGIKKCWIGAFIMGFIFGLTLLLTVFSLDYFDVYGYSAALKALSITFSIIVLVFMTLFTSFFMTQNAAFKMRPAVLIRNSVLFVIGTHIQSVIMIGVGLAPVYFIFIPGATMLLVMLYVFLGISFSTLAITLFTHYCYEKFLYDKVADKPSTIYAKRQNDQVADDGKQQTKKQAVAYKNPKKHKKSIDDGASITPLTPMFRREDLERLQKEHDIVMRESEESADDDEEQADDGEKTVDTSETQNQ